MWEHTADIFHSQHIGARGNQVAVIVAFIRPDKYMIVPKQHIASFNMTFFGRTDHFMRIDLFNNMIYRFELAFTIRKDVRFYKDVINHETDVACKYLVVVFNKPWPKNDHIIFLKNFVDGLHLHEHICFTWIRAGKNVFKRFWIVGLMLQWRWPVAFGCP